MFKKMKDVKKVGIILAIITVIVGTIVFKVSADNSKSYVIDVINAKDSTAQNLDEDDVLETSNDDVKIHKQIEKDNAKAPFYDDKNLTYKVKVDNIIQRTNPEVALLVDTSYSVSINDAETKLKNAAKTLVEQVYSSCIGAKMQLFNASASKTQKVVLYNNATNKNNITNTINNLIVGDGSDIRNGLEAVRTSFTQGDNIAKYLIVFTDSTDYVKEALKGVNSNDINVIAISIDNIINDGYENAIIKMVYSNAYIEEHKKADTEETDGVLSHKVTNQRRRRVETI